MSNAASTYAMELISALTPSAPIELAALANTLGLEIEYCSASGFDGALICSKSNRVGTILVKDSIREPGRKRFTIAHEIGHYVLPHHGHAGCLCGSDDVESWAQSIADHEREANIFASELLVPRALVTEKVRQSHPTFDLIRDIAGTFSTSLTASAYRVMDLTGFRAAIVWSTRGVIRWFKSSDEFDAFVSVGDRVEQGSYAYDCFKRKTVPDELKSVHANLWLVSPEASSDGYVLEHSVWMPFYDSVLTLLYLETPSSAARYDDDGRLEELDPEDFTLRRRRWPR
jgi:Zn-dependent peptidase ImmA (M78 family)